MAPKDGFGLGGEQYQGQGEDTAGMAGGLPAPAVPAPAPAPPVKPFAGKFGKTARGKGKPFPRRGK